MANDLGLGITLSLKDQFTSASKNVSRSMGQMRQNANDTVSTMQRMQGAITAMAGAAIFMASKRVFGSLLDSASSFEKSMAEVSTLVNTTTVNMDGLSAATIALSKKFGFPALEQAKGLYQVLSAGIGDTSESLQVMDIANQIALGGVTDVTTAVDGLTTILNAWKMKAGDASDVADTLFTTMRLGKTTIPELSNFIFQAAPLASALGISLEELGASIVTMTKQGTKTPIAMTQIRNVMAALIRPSDDLNKIWKSLGLQSGENAIKQLGLQKALAKLVDKTKGSKSALMELLGSQEAVQAALQLSGENTLSFNDTMDQMQKKAGATSEAVKKMQAIHDNRVARMQASLESLKITIGKRLLIAMEPLINKVVEFVNKMDVWLAKHPKLATAIAGTLGVLTLLGIALGVVAAIMGLVTLVSVPVIVVFLKIAAVVGLVIGAFMLLKPVFIKLWNDNQALVQKLKAGWDWFVANIWPVIRNIISAFVQLHIVVYTAVFRGIGRAIQFAVSLIQAWWAETKANLQLIMDAWTIFKDAISPVTNFVIKVFEKFKTGIGNAISSVVGFIQGLIDKIVEFLSKMPLVQKSFEIIGKTFRFGKKIFGGLTDAISEQFDEINQSVQDSRNNIHQMAEDIRNKNTKDSGIALLGDTTNSGIVADNSASIVTTQNPGSTSPLDLTADQNKNISLVASKNPNLASTQPQITNTINVPPAKITPSDIILDKQKIGKVIFDMQQLQTVRSN